MKYIDWSSPLNDELRWMTIYGEEGRSIVNDEWRVNDEVQCISTVNNDIDELQSTVNDWVRWTMKYKQVWGTAWTMTDGRRRMIKIVNK